MFPIGVIFVLLGSSPSVTQIFGIHIIKEIARLYTPSLPFLLLFRALAADEVVKRLAVPKNARVFH